MAELSNQLMVITVLAYLAAMVGHAAEYAFGNRSHIGRAAARPARQLVGAGAPVEPPPVTEPAVAEPAAVEPATSRRDRGELLGRIGVGFNALALLVHLGTRPFVTLSVRYDPAQRRVLAGAVLGLIGLMLSLGGHRRRVWFRMSPRAPSGPGRGGTVMEAGGLPRTDYPGFGDEFAGVVRAAKGDAAKDDEGTA